MKSITILGLMSGTSLDGLDLCIVEFSGLGQKWDYKIKNSRTIPYSDHWQKKLTNALHLSGLDLTQTHVDLGFYFGEQINDFLKTHTIKVDYIASHGHTIFHQPAKKMTLQIGCGHSIYAQTNIPVIYDFRSLDIALSGQGAPLVPIGDKLLFGDFTACINFGGIANISYHKNGQRLAFDICPVNMGLNMLANELNLPYDDKGALAQQGQIDPDLLTALNQLPFYKEKGPKSLGIEWYLKNVKDLIQNQNISLNDRLHTFTIHIAEQVVKIINKLPQGKILITGGGAYNQFLVSTIQNNTNHEIIVPNNELINYKEALIFAFLGLLKTENQINVLKSVTGALKDSSSGIVVGY